MELLIAVIVMENVLPEMQIGRLRVLLLEVWEIY